MRLSKSLMLALLAITVVAFAAPARADYCANLAPFGDVIQVATGPKGPGTFELNGHWWFCREIGIPIYDIPISGTAHLVPGGAWHFALSGVNDPGVCQANGGAVALGLQFGTGAWQSECNGGFTASGTIVTIPCPAPCVEGASPAGPAAMSY